MVQPQYSCGPPLSRELTREKHEKFFSGQPIAPPFFKRLACLIPPASPRLPLAGLFDVASGVLWVQPL